MGADEGVCRDNDGLSSTIVDTNQREAWLVYVLGTKTFVSCIDYIHTVVQQETLAVRAWIHHVGTGEFNPNTPECFLRETQPKSTDYDFSDFR